MAELRYPTSERQFVMYEALRKVLQLTNHEHKIKYFIEQMKER